MPNPNANGEPKKNDCGCPELSTIKCPKHELHLRYIRPDEAISAHCPYCGMGLKEALNYKSPDNVFCGCKKGADLSEYPKHKVITLEYCEKHKPKDLREEICELVTSYIMDKEGHLTWAQLTELRELINPNQNE